MAWFAELAGKAESLLNNLDEQTGAALRNRNGSKGHKNDKNEITGRRQISRHGKPLNMHEARNTNPPIKKLSAKSRKPIDLIDEKPTKLNKSPLRSRKYDLNHSPRTLVQDHNMQISSEAVGDINTKYRRLSLPNELELVTQSYSHKVQTLEIENTMLKNENLDMTKQLTDLIDKLKHVDNKYNVKLTEGSNMKEELVSFNIQSLNSNEELSESTVNQVLRLREITQGLEEDLIRLRDTNQQLIERITTMEFEKAENDKTHTKLDNDIRQAQNTIKDLQVELSKCKDECQRLETDWETYKLRVKNMLIAKDREIKLLQESPTSNEQTKEFIGQLDHLRSEREQLSHMVESVRGECVGMKTRVQELEARSLSAERLVIALRDALREEHAARTKLDVDCMALTKELEHMKSETGQTIANLRSALSDRELEVQHMKTISSSVYVGSEPGTLNVADYDVMQDTLLNQKIQYLTDALVTKQTKIDSLMADNNMLRIQKEKVETKYRNELSAMNFSHVKIQAGDNNDSFRTRPRNRYIPDSELSRISLRIGLFMRRHPLFRMLIMLYMIGLHIWVLLVLLTYTPDGINAKRTENIRH